jgi:hypothetical protein
MLPAVFLIDLFYLGTLADAGKILEKRFEISLDSRAGADDNYNSGGQP